jgi:hypothetical protein
VSARVKAEPLRAKQSKAKQSKAKQSKAKQSKAKQSKAKQSKAKPNNKIGKKQNSTPARGILPSRRRLCTGCAACLMPPPYQSYPPSPNHRATQS